MMKETIGNHGRIFHAATKSSRHRSARIGVTVVRLDSQ